MEQWSSEAVEQCSSGADEVSNFRSVNPNFVLCQTLVSGCFVR